MSNKLKADISRLKLEPNTISKKDHEEFHHEDTKCTGNNGDGNDNDHDIDVKELARSLWSKAINSSGEQIVSDI